MQKLSDREKKLEESGWTKSHGYIVPRWSENDLFSKFEDKHGIPKILDKHEW